MDSNAPNPAVREPTEVTSDIELEAFRSRVAEFIRSQPDVGEFDDLGDGFYGVEVAGVARGVSLVIRQTE